MRGMIGSVLVLLGFFTVAAAQLPPEVQADAYLLAVEQAIGDGNYDRAWDRLQDIVRLQQDHDLDLPEFHFWYAKAAVAMNLPEQALESVTEYLTAAGRQASHYAEALALMNTLQTTVSCEGWDAGAYFDTATLEQVTACLETGNVDLEAGNASGLTPLQAAATHAEDPAVIQALLDAGAQVEATDTVSGATPLSLAIRDNGTPAIIEVLLAAGANPETPNTIGLTPLHLAALHADDPVVYEILLTARSGLTTPDQMLEAAERSIEILIEAGADPTHLEQALDSVVRDLAAAGPDGANGAAAQALMERVQTAVSCTGWNTTAYFETAMPDQVAACLATGTVDLKARGATGLTPLQAAAVDATNPGVLETLLASGADPTATSRVESGRLEAGDEVPLLGFTSTLPWYQDRYSFEGGFETVVVEAQSDDRAPSLVVESPSGASIGFGRRFEDDDERSQLSLTLGEFGEYQVRVYDIVFDGDNGDYTLRVTREAPGYLAARSNENLAVLQVFLNAGLDLDHKKADGSTLLHAAARNENPAVIQALLAAGADVNEDDERGRTALHLAARYHENPEVLEALIAAGSNVREDDDNDWTPLHFASRNNENPAIVEVLLAAGANIEEEADDGYRALHLAAASNENPAVAQTLLDSGAELRPSAGDFRNTPLRLAAASNENPAVVQVLIDAGADVNDGTRFSGNTALHYAASNANLAVVQTLLNAGANLQVENDNGATPLHRAALSNENLAMIEFLTAAGADLEARNDDGETPLHRAARYNDNPAVIEALLAAGADPLSEDSDDSTALHLAARYNGYNENPAVLEALLAAGFDLEAQDDEERTPLHLAARYNENSAVVEALLAAGADIEAVDEDGRTPLYRATDENDNAAVREALLRAGAGQTERQRAAAQARREANSGPGLLGAAIGIVGGTAIAAAGGGTEESLAAGADFAEMVIGGQTPAGSPASAPGVAATGTPGFPARGGSCEIPGFPNPSDMTNLGLSWCPARVEFQVRVFALQAEGMRCAVAANPSEATPEVVSRVRSQIREVCARLDALVERLGGPTDDCRCPAGFGP